MKLPISMMSIAVALTTTNSSKPTCRNGNSEESGGAKKTSLRATARSVVAVVSCAASAEARNATASSFEVTRSCPVRSLKTATRSSMSKAGWMTLPALSVNVRRSSRVAWSVIRVAEVWSSRFRTATNPPAAVKIATSSSSTTKLLRTISTSSFELRKSSPVPPRSRANAPTTVDSSTRKEASIC